MRRVLGFAVLALALQSCAPILVDDEVGTSSRTYYGFSVSVSNAPPPPALQWVRRPELDRIDGTNVYVVDEPEFDVFVFRGTYWLSYRGYWYQADDYGGPFMVVDVRSVPRQILRLPDRYWRHDPRERRYRDRDDRDRDRDRDRDWDGRS